MMYLTRNAGKYFTVVFKSILFEIWIFFKFGFPDRETEDNFLITNPNKGIQDQWEPQTVK